MIMEMANLRPQDTKLAYIIYASVKQHSSGPRIKVVNGVENCSISISEKPVVVAGNSDFINGSDYSMIIAWIIQKKSILLDFWDSKLTDKEFKKLIK